MVFVVNSKMLLFFNWKRANPTYLNSFLCWNVYVLLKVHEINKTEKTQSIRTNSFYEKYNLRFD